MTARCRIHEWDELALAEEWRDSVPKVDRFRGWTELEKRGARVSNFDGTREYWRHDRNAAKQDVDA